MDLGEKSAQGPSRVLAT